MDQTRCPETPDQIQLDTFPEHWCPINATLKSGCEVKDDDHYYFTDDVINCCKMTGGEEYEDMTKYLCILSNLFRATI